MFNTAAIPFDLAGARLKLEEQEDGEEALTLVEANLVMDPWPFELLRELGDDAAAHVFLPDGRVKPELKSIKISPTRGRLQVFKCSGGRDAAPLLTISPVVVEYFKFDRREDDRTGRVWVKGVMRVLFEFRDKTVRTLLAQHFGRRIFVTTEGLEGRLNFEAPPEEPGVDDTRQPRLKEGPDGPPDQAPPAAPSDRPKPGPKLVH